MDKEPIKLYTMKELKELEGTYYYKIANSDRYIPVKVMDGKTKYAHKKWYTKTDYSLRYIRIEDIENYLKKSVKIVLTDKE